MRLLIRNTLGRQKTLGGRTVVPFGLGQSETELSIELRPSLGWPAWLLYGGVFIIVFAYVAASLPYSPSAGIVVLGVLFAVPFLFYITYRESLVATRSALRIEHRCLGFVSWSQQYSVEDVRWFRAVEEEFSEDEGWAMSLMPRSVAAGVAASDGRVYRRILGCGTNQLAFNVGTRTHSAGPGLTTDEATAIAGLIRDWIHAHQLTVDPAYS